MKLNLISTINCRTNKKIKNPKIWTFHVFEGLKKLGFSNQKFSDFVPPPTFWCRSTPMRTDDTSCGGHSRTVARDPVSSWGGGRKQQGPCKLKVGGPVPPFPPGSAAYDDNTIVSTLFFKAWHQNQQFSYFTVDSVSDVNLKTQFADAVKIV